MRTYSIAGLTVNMEAIGKTVVQAEKYRIADQEKADVTLTYNPDACKKAIQDHPELSPEVYVYMLLGKRFADALLDYDGFVLHSSAVSYQNNAYLFSADSGTGKSTHTQLWKRCFDGAEIINDDKPAIRLIDGNFYVFGTPWSGSTPLNKNVSVPLKAICFIERGEKNSIERMTDNAKIIHLLLSQTLRRVGPDKTDKLFAFIDKLIRNVPIYKLSCLPDEDAAKLAYSIMSK